MLKPFYDSKLTPFLVSRLWCPSKPESTGNVWEKEKMPTLTSSWFNALSTDVKQNLHYVHASNDEKKGISLASVLKLLIAPKLIRIQSKKNFKVIVASKLEGEREKKSLVCQNVSNLTQF